MRADQLVKFRERLIKKRDEVFESHRLSEEERLILSEHDIEREETAEDYIDQVKNMATTYFEKGKDLVEKESNIITKVVEAGKEAYEKEKQVKFDPEG